MAPAGAAHASEEPVLLDVKRFVIEGANPLSQEETQRVLKPYLGPHTSLATLETAASTLQEAIRTRGFSFHRVIVPAQQPAPGDLVLRILPFTLGDVNVLGNKHFSAENIRRSLPGLKPGVSPNLPHLSQEVTLANEHPSKRLTLQVKEGVKPDTVDSDVRVVDVAPSQFFIGLIGGTKDLDNTVNRNTGYTRVTVGFQHSNLFDRDHTLTLAYTTSPDHPNDVQQYGAFYTLPLYGYNTMLTGYYTRSDINSGSIGIGSQSLNVSGVGEFYGMKATYALPKFGEISQNTYVSLDQRYFESSVAFQGTALPTSAVGSRPLTLGYSMHTERSDNTIAASIEYAVNLQGGRANTDPAYAAARAGATQNWNAWRFSVDGKYGLPRGWSLKARARAQYSDDALIPGEQLGVTGLTSVRGFREREVAGDRAYFLNVEAHGPALIAGIAPFVFYDQGARSIVTPVPGFPRNEFVSSTGAGVRWQWQRLELGALWALVLNGVQGGTQPDYYKFYFTAFYRF